MPEPCSTLETVTNPLEYVARIGLCTTALGVFGAGEAAICLTELNPIDVFNCLTDLYDNYCITELPVECTELGDPGLVDFTINLATCATKLGPWAIGTAATCFSSSWSNGQEALDCINTALGFDSGSSPTSPVATETPTLSEPVVTPTATFTPPVIAGPGCPEMPAPCSALETLTNPLEYVTAIAACTTALGVFGTGQAAVCVAELLPSDVFTCLDDLFQSFCLTELPEECTSLADPGLVDFTVNLAACAVTLGPWAAGTAAVCFSSSFGNGQDALDCITQNLGLA